MTEQAQGQPTSSEANAEAQGQRPSAAFDQESVKKIAANEKREGKRARESELLQATGYESIDDLMTAATEYRALQEATASEADKANERAEKYEARFKEANARYTQTLKEFSLRDALRDADINPERMKLALKVADVNSLEVADDGSVSGVEGVVEQIQTDSPEWFTNSQQEPRRTITSPQATREATPQGNTYEGGIASHIFRTLNSGP
jgi:hypothetical protein